jgi:adenine-specific DNA-methyltransferase
MLEPSAGGGIFIKLAKVLSPNIEVTAIDIDQNAIGALAELGLAQCVEADFLTHHFAFGQYNIVIGNPPYVSWRNMSESSRNVGRRIIEEAGLSIPSLNMWGLFLLKAEKCLTNDGVMAFILPSDIKETIAGGVVLNQLKCKFSRIELFDVPSGTFETAEQSTTILIGYRKHKKNGLFSGEVCLQSNLLKVNRAIWNSFNFFSKASFPFTDDIFAPLLNLYEKLPKIGDICTTSPGIVTAANKYFIVSRDKASLLGVEKPSKRIIPKGQIINGKLDITDAFFQELCDENIGCYLFDVSNEHNLTKEATEYLNKGVSLRLPDRYKMKRRSPWYRIPSVWTSECLFFKRSHMYPKLISNDANLLITDAAYRLILKNGITKKSLLPSFYNSFTLLFAELLGRKYAGGVLELTPNEFKRLPIPYKQHSKDEYEEFKEAFNKKNSIDEILDENSAHTLSGYVSSSFIKEINILYNSILSTRLGQ